MAYIGVNIYSYNSGITYDKGDIVADSSAAQVYGTVAAAIAGATQLTLTATAGTPAVGMVISSLAGVGIPAGTTITSVSGSGPYTVGLSQALTVPLASSSKVGAALYWQSAVNNNKGNTPSVSSPFWTAQPVAADATVNLAQNGLTPYTWVFDGTNGTLTTDALKVETHDKFTGTVFNTGAAGNLYIQQSSDGKNWDYVSSAVTTGSATIDNRYGTLAGFSNKFSEEVIAPYIRLKFVYATTLPTVFRLNARTSDSGVKYQVTLWIIKVLSTITTKLNAPDADHSFSREKFNQRQFTIAAQIAAMIFVLVREAVLIEVSPRLLIQK